MPHWIITWADWCGAKFTQATNLNSYKRSVTRNSMRRFSYCWPSESALRKICTSINQPYLIWAAVNRHVPPPKDQEDWDPQSKKGVGIGRKRRSRRVPWWGEVAQRWSSAGQLNFNYKILVAVSTNIELCEFNNRGTRYQTWKNSKRVWGSGYGPFITDINVS